MSPYTARVECLSRSLPQTLGKKRLCFSNDSWYFSKRCFKRVVRSSACLYSSPPPNWNRHNPYYGRCGLGNFTGGGRAKKFIVVIHLSYTFRFFPTGSVSLCRWVTCLLPILCLRRVVGGRKRRRIPARRNSNIPRNTGTVYFMRGGVFKTPEGDRRSEKQRAKRQGCIHQTKKEGHHRVARFPSESDEPGSDEGGERAHAESEAEAKPTGKEVRPSFGTRLRQEAHAQNVKKGRKPTAIENGNARLPFCSCVANSYILYDCIVWNRWIRTFLRLWKKNVYQNITLMPNGKKSRLQQWPTAKEKNRA